MMHKGCAYCARGLVADLAPIVVPIRPVVSAGQPDKQREDDKNHEHLPDVIGNTWHAAHSNTERLI